LATLQAWLSTSSAVFGKENALFLEPFCTKNELFTKTGSGQT
jgi:hypothetical protein